MEGPEQKILPGIKPCPQCGTGVKFREDAESGRKSCPHCGYVLPTQVAHFKLLDIIGTGGMGAVYRGLDISLERAVAVKVMREDFAKNPQFVENFLREARAAASLNHPNIVQIYSFGEQNSRYYLVMELLPKGSLDDRIEHEHRIPELDALDIGIQVASGLRAANERGLIHRDIKPGNILCSQDGLAKVVDFGLARFASTPTPKEEGIWGTPYYIAPEKVSDGKEDFRSDIYSLGGTLFHALAGRAPFEAGTSSEVVLKHLNSPAISLRAFAPDCTSQTVEVISRMLKRDPAERHQSYDELLNDLAYAKRFALEKKPVEHVASQNEFSMGMLVGTLVLMLLCIGLGTWFWLNRAHFLGDDEENAAPSVTQTNARPSLAVTARTNAAAPTAPPATATNAPPAPPPPPDYVVQVEHAHEQAALGRLAPAIAQLEAIERSLPPNHDLHPWVRLHLARAKQMMGHDAEAATLLAGFIGSATPETLGNPVPPEKYPLLVALVMAGKLGGDELEKIIPPLPRWVQAAVRYDAGRVAAQQCRLADVAVQWKEYIHLEPEKGQSWASSYQPMARDFVNEYESFRNFEKDVEALKTAGKFQEMQSLLRDGQTRWQSPLILARLAQMNEVARQAMAAIQRAQEEKNKAERARQAENEKKLLDAMRVRQPQLMAAYQFAQLLSEWKVLDPKIRLEENRRPVERALALSQCLTDFQEQLAKDIQATPYDQERMVTRSNLRMAGTLYQLKDGKFCFRKVFGPDQVGEMSCRWQDLSPSAILELGDFYLMLTSKCPEPNNSEVARRAITLALFAREFGLPQKYISGYLTLAEQTGANIHDMLAQLFPPEPPPR